MLFTAMPSVAAPAAAKTASVSLMYFVLGLFLGDGQQTYMLRQLICSAATIPATMSFYKQDKIAEQVVYGTEKEKLDTKWLDTT